MSDPTPADIPGGELSVLVEALHDRLFGVASHDDPALALKEISDGGGIHEVAHSLVRALPPRGAVMVVDPQPEIVGDPICKIVSYNQLHEDAVEMGYPSVLEALEHLDELRTPTASHDAARERIARIIDPDAARHRIAAEARSHDGEWEVEYEVWQKDAFGPECDGMVAGSCSLAEAQHYVAVYGQDSPAWLVEVRRRVLSALPLFDEGRL